MGFEVLTQQTKEITVFRVVKPHGLHLQGRAETVNIPTAYTQNTGTLANQQLQM